MKVVEVKVDWAGHIELSLRLELDDQNQIAKSDLKGIGGPQLLSQLKSLRARLQGDLKSLALPSGRSPEDLAIRELFLKARGEWDYPYKEEELCHCRAVLTAVVDQAICHGAHTPRKVSEMTSASTACGTCRPDVEAILRFRLS